MFRRLAASTLIAAGFLLAGTAQAGDFRHDFFRHDFHKPGFDGRRGFDFDHFDGKSRFRRQPFGFDHKFHANFAKKGKFRHGGNDFFDFFRPDFGRHHATPFGKGFKH